MRLLLFVWGILAAIQAAAQYEPKGFAKWVNPFIGTGGFGHTFPGATTPFGMVQLSPDTRVDGSWEGCSGYHYSDSLIYGFSHTHLSGTGCSDYGDVMLMPTYGGSLSDKHYASRFWHEHEKARAGYYSVEVLDRGVLVELTATTRVGMHRYNFKEGGKPALVLDLTHRDKLLEGAIEQKGKTMLSGFRSSEAWARRQTVYFHIEFSEPIYKIEMQEGKKALVYFDVDAKTPLLVKVALSSIDAEAAQRNMEAELPDWDFEQTVAATQAVWDKELSKIEIKARNNDDYTIFYTALYHAFIQPNVYSDVDGRYRGRDGAVHQAEGFDYYSVFSLWDTYRAAHPLYTIIDKKRTLDFIKTFLAQYEHGGRLPVWELWCNETDCMIGYHSVSVIADAAAKGIDEFDNALAYEAMCKSANWNHLGLPVYTKNGFLTMDDEHEHVSKTLEYAYDDWCIAQFAQRLGKTEEADVYYRRAQSYRHLFDPVTRFMRPIKNGDWLSPFEPREVNNNFTEANSWQYTFSVPHDINGLMELMGGMGAFNDKLDGLFSAEATTTGREQVDITGLIGQYAHGNEPSHHIAYLYTCVGKPYKTQELVRRIIGDFYKNSPEGLIGNEDCGQMSAWFLLSSMGFYPICPGKPEYVIGVPHFEEVVINLENGKRFVIAAENVLKPYIEQAELNGVPHFSTRLQHAEIAQGGNLRFVMGDDFRNSKFKVGSVTESKFSVLHAPTISVQKQEAGTKVVVEITHYNDGCSVYYTTDGSTPTAQSTLYTKSFVLDKSGSVKAMAVMKKGDEELQSPVQTAYFHKKPNNWTVSIKGEYNKQYTAGGDNGIIDGIRGADNWRKGDWQGYQGQDVEITIDLKKEQLVEQVSMGFLQDTRSWILMPKSVEIYASLKGKSFEKVGSMDNTTPADDMNVQIKEWVISTKPNTARYLRLQITHAGKLPDWHPGAGYDAFFFLDEVGK